VSLALLRLQLSEVLDTTKPGTPGLATGLRTLDSALPLGGLPRGRLTELVGAPGAGKTTVVRHIVERAVRDGWCVAYIDATRTLAPRDWAHINTLNPRASDNLWVVRPDRPDRGAWCADVLLRSGAFALVVLDGDVAGEERCAVEYDNVAVRLTRLAREADSALLALSDDNKASELAGSLRLRVAKTKSQRTAVIIEKGAPYQTVTVGEAPRGNEVARRVRTHPEVPDRRGVARKQKRERPASRINSRSRRAGEPRIPSEPFIAGNS
jgi:hypothetical protein